MFDSTPNQFSKSHFVELFCETFLDGLFYFFLFFLLEDSVGGDGLKLAKNSLSRRDSKSWKSWSKSLLNKVIPICSSGSENSTCSDREVLNEIQIH